MAVFSDYLPIDLTHTTIEGLTGALGGEGNLGDDPLFVDPDGGNSGSGPLPRHRRRLDHSAIPKSRTSISTATCATGTATATDGS